MHTFEGLSGVPYYNEHRYLNYYITTFTPYGASSSGVVSANDLYGNHSVREVATWVPLSDVYNGASINNDPHMFREGFIPTKELIKRVKHVTKFFPPNDPYTNLLVLLSDKLYTEEQYLYYLNYAFKYGLMVEDSHTVTPEDVFRFAYLDANLSHVFSVFDSHATYNDIKTGLLKGVPSPLTEPTNLFKRLSASIAELESVATEPLMCVVPVICMLVESVYTERTAPPPDFYEAVFIKPFKDTYSTIANNPSVLTSLFNSFYSGEPYDFQLVLDCVRGAS